MVMLPTFAAVRDNALSLFPGERRRERGSTS